MRRNWFLLVLLLMAGLAWAASDTIPSAIHYQGKLSEGNIRYEGDALFRFAVVDDTTPTPLILWSNDGTQLGKTADNIPSAAVTLNVKKGLFQVALGDDAITNMTSIPKVVFGDNSHVYLRVWFQKDAGSAISLLSPDARLLAVPYAFRAGSVDGVDIEDESIIMGKLARESVGPEHEGRSNTIRSIYFDKTYKKDIKTIYEVPDGKTFVITDIFIMAGEKGGIWTFTNTPSSELEQYFKFCIDARGTTSLTNWSHSFKSGIRFVSPEVVAIFPQDTAQNLRIRGTIHGFEFATPK